MSEEKKFDPTTARLLIGHTNPKNAFIQPDYPYGRKLRCQRRVWVEENRHYGMRLVTQTTNPKRAGEVWNKAHPETYADFVALWADAKDFIQTDSIANGMYDFKPLHDWGNRNHALITANEYVRTRYLAHMQTWERSQAGKEKRAVRLVKWDPNLHLVYEEVSVAELLRAIA